MNSSQRKSDSDYPRRIPLSQYQDFHLYLSDLSRDIERNQNPDKEINQDGSILPEGIIPTTRFEESNTVNNDNEGSLSEPSLFGFQRTSKSPSNQYPNTIPQYKNRRVHKPWSTNEFVALVEGMETYGTRWSMIKSDIRFAEILRKRTVVDLKDKARVERNARCRRYGVNSSKIEIFTLVSGKGGEGALKYTSN